MVFRMIAIIGANFSRD
ncbi:unnamed protein product [Medioppia subpectinata]|uniref:Uncharacterized protein n=1 Tax=Medioppia subpectinata TaxID=1979941 RepID=A0A7R9QMM5_9ACAR|nr:unnamed protein product [Medioppia subpectinata]CAG2123190.1 unnamed protein product [Medioppia subpectinata]